MEHRARIPIPIKSIISNEILIYSSATSFQKRDKNKTMFGACFRFFCAPVEENTPPNPTQFNGKLIVKYFLRI